jgi:hypothetical protein
MLDMHHHVMALEEDRVAIWRLSDLPDLPGQSKPETPRITQAASGAWVLKLSDERLPRLLRNCGDGVFVVDERAAGQRDVSRVFEECGIPSPGSLPLDGLVDALTQRLLDAQLTEDRQRLTQAEATGRRPTWKRVPWPTLDLEMSHPQCEPPAQAALRLCRLVERCFDTWDEIESQRLRRAWLRRDEESGGPSRLQINGTPSGWMVSRLAVGHSASL